MGRLPKRTMLVVADPSGDFRPGACFDGCDFAGTLHDKWWPVGMVVEQVETGVQYQVTEYLIVWSHGRRNMSQHRLVPTPECRQGTRALVAWRPWVHAAEDLYFLREVGTRLG